MSQAHQSPYGRQELMPDIAFRIMALFFFLRENMSAAKLDQFGIQPGDKVVDFGCGPGAYIRRASRLAGDQGRVFAVDIHPLAIRAIERKKTKYKLTNVTPLLATGYPGPLGDRTADIIYALDMFHMVTRPTEMLKELHRILKPGGRLILDDGHQPRTVTKKKILGSGLWTIKEERAGWLICAPA